MKIFLLKLFCIPLVVVGYSKIDLTPSQFSINQRVCLKFTFDLEEENIQQGDIVQIQLPFLWELPKINNLGINNYLWILTDKEKIYPIVKITNKSIDDISTYLALNVFEITIDSTIRSNISYSLIIFIGTPDNPELCVKSSRFAGLDYFYYRIIKMNGTSDLLGKKIYFKENPGPANEIRVTIPSTCMVGETITAKITVLDSVGNRVNNFNSTFIIRNKDSSIWNYGAIDTGYAEINLFIQKYGNDSIYVVTNTGLCGVSNPIVIDTCKTLNIYWGDPHTHSIYSNHGRGLPSQLLEYARYANHLDWLAYTEHDWIRKSYSDTSIDQLNAANIDSKFITFNGLEWTSRDINQNNLYGHLNLLSRNSNGVRISGFNLDINNLYSYCYSDYKLGIINHPIGPYNFKWECLDTNIIRLAEIVGDAFWGIESFEFNQPNMLGKSIRTALNEGVVIGFSGGSDNHYSQPGTRNTQPNKRGGSTAVLCEELTRNSVFFGLLRRHTFVTTGARMFINFRCNKGLMGDIIEISDDNKNIIETFNIHVLGTDNIDTIEVVKNGSVIWKQSRLGKKEINTTIYDTIKVDLGMIYYYLRVRQINKEIGWSSPIFFQEKKKCDTNIFQNIIFKNDVFDVYPNPAKEYITIKLNSNLNCKNINVKVYDILGREIDAFDFKPPMNTYKFKNNKISSNGVYFITLFMNNKIYSKKFILMK